MAYLYQNVCWSVFGTLTIKILHDVAVVALTESVGGRHGNGCGSHIQLHLQCSKRLHAWAMQLDANALTLSFMLLVRYPEVMRKRISALLPVLLSRLQSESRGTSSISYKIEQNLSRHLHVLQRGVQSYMWKVLCVV